MNNETANRTVSFRQLTGLFLLAMTIGACIPVAQAATITAYSGATGPGLGSVIFGSASTPNDGNDNIVGISPNLLIIDQKSFANSDYIDIVFQVVDFGVPTCEYSVSEFVSNNTSDNWIGYQVQLGFGTGVSFVSVGVGTGLDFDTPDYDSPMDFSPYSLGAFDHGTINAVGATVVPTSVMLFTFSIDVPSGITEFTLRQTPRPEPISSEAKTWSGLKTLFR